MIKTYKKRGFFLIGIVLLVLFAFVGIVSAAQTWYVDDSGVADFTKIQDAVNTCTVSKEDTSASSLEVAPSYYYDGFWVGMTNQGNTVSFNVSEDTVKDFYIEMRLTCWGGTGYLKSHTRGNFSIQNSSFTISGIGDDDTHVGTFLSPKEAQGTWYHPEDRYGCWGSGTWWSQPAAAKGDFDGDGDVDFDDFVVFAGAYGTSKGDPTYDVSADFDDDGDVDFDDFVEFAGVYTG